MMRKRKIITLAFISLLFLAWMGAPTLAVWSMAFASGKGEESSRRACDRIVFFGERSIRPAIASIERESPWVRRYCYLPIALKEIGGAAHSELLAAIDRQDDPRKRAYLVSTLQTAFDDYSRLAVIIEDAQEERISTWALTRFSNDLRHTFPDGTYFSHQGTHVESRVPRVLEGTKQRTMSGNRR